MKRLVYSPSINAWVKTDTGIFDLSPYITGCTIDRRINSLSYAKLTFRNPKVSDDSGKSRFLFTEHVREDGSIHPLLHPMDPIIITMTRLKGRPIQVFTGFCDTTPYVQLFPGTTELTASCTLKRLLYTYWDPALPFVREWMQSHGWFVTKNGLALNPQAEQKKIKNDELKDTSIGFLLYNVLKDVGGWNYENIFIQGLPPKIGDLVTKIYQDVSHEETNSIKEFQQFLHNILGASHYGSLAIGGGDGSGGGGTTGNVNGNQGRIAYGNVIIDSSADAHTPGVWDPRNADHMDNTIVELVHEVAGVWGKTIIITTGVCHSYYTTNGSVSDHAMGKGADMGCSANLGKPIGGEDLIKFGRAALKAFGYAGWETANSGPSDYSRIHITRNGKKLGVQVIFNQEGHYNHLHIGYKEES